MSSAVPHTQRMVLSPIKKKRNATQSEETLEPVTYEESQNGICTESITEQGSTSLVTQRRSLSVDYVQSKLLPC